MQNGKTLGRNADKGVTLIELLCVIAIIAILAALLLPAISRAYSKEHGMSEEWEAGEILSLLTKETRGYCAAQPQYVFLTKSEFIDKCGFAPNLKTGLKLRPRSLSRSVSWTRLTR
jgi:prepilin-type N-terminal cleavage/methylation domain-containing protein